MPGVSTRRSTLHQEKTASTLKNDLTVAVSEDSDHLPQRSAASSSRHSVASIVPALLNLGSLCSAGQQVRQHDSVASSFSGTGKVQGNEFVASVASRRKRDRDLNRVRTCSEGQHLHDYLERKAELALRGESAVQRRLTDAEADLEVRRWEQKNCRNSPL